MPKLVNVHFVNLHTETKKKMFKVETKEWRSNRSKNVVTHKSRDMFIPIDIVKELMPVRVSHNKDDDFATVTYNKLSRRINIEEGGLRFLSVLHLIMEEERNIGANLTREEIRRVLRIDETIKNAIEEESKQNNCC